MKKLLLLGALIAITAATKPAPKAAKMPGGAGQSIVAAKCAGCHALSQVTNAHKNAADWATTVDTMMDRGAQVSDAEYPVLNAYLAKNFGVKKK